MRHANNCDGHADGKYADGKCAEGGDNGLIGGWGWEGIDALVNVIHHALCY